MDEMVWNFLIFELDYFTRGIYACYTQSESDYSDQ